MAMFLPSQAVASGFHSEILGNLSKGKYTDCVFLVGTEEDQQQVHAVKSMLMMASPYMRTLLSKNWSSEESNKPITLPLQNPKIFRLVIEFTHIGFIHTKMSCVEMAELAVVADYFLITPLKKYCIELLSIHVKIEDVWPVLNKVLQEANLVDVADSCMHVLQNKTSKCLAHVTFASAIDKSIIFMLQLKKLSVKNEMALVRSCISWAKAQPAGIMAIRTLLPHLRLLCLTGKEIADLPNVLLDNEVAYLLKKKLCSNPNAINDSPSQICDLKISREFDHSMSCSSCVGSDEDSAEDDM